ncbi:MAG: hypothetical protein R3F34_20375, partial [Planctomycetota bacterium]
MARRSTRRHALLGAGLALLASCATGRDGTGDAERGGGPAIGSFPARWLGTWRGEVEVLAREAPRPGFDMELEVARTDDPARYTWRTTYGTGDDGVRDVRDYELVVRDASRGAYAIDEGNGIVLEATLLGGVLTTWFEIETDAGTTRLLVREELVRAGTDDAAIMFEL